MEGQLGVSIELLSNELSQARQLDSLNARVVITLCADLQDFTADSYTRQNLGPVGSALDRRIAELNSLIWSHFAPSLMRLKPLETLVLLPNENAADIVSELKFLLTRFETVPADSGAQPDKEAMAVLKAMLRRLEDLERRLRNASSDDEKEAVASQFSSLVGLLTTTLARGGWRSAEVRQQLREKIDELLKDYKRASGIGKLVQDVAEFFERWFGGSGPPPTG